MVSFRHGNLVEPASYEGLAPLDAIFCRNVLIYFSDAMILRVVRHFHEHAGAGRLPVPRPRGIAVAHHRPVPPIRFQGAMVYQGRGRRRRARGRRVIRVLVVDDSAFVRQALTRMLGGAPDIEVVGTAVDGQDGLEKTLALRPDVVTLDVKMPRMDGLEALRRIMNECPTPVLLLSSLTSEGADVTLRGLELGAMDFVDKSSVQGHMNLLGLADELRAKVRALAGVPQRRAPVATARAAAQRCGTGPRNGAAGRHRHLHRRSARAAGDHPAPARRTWRRLCWWCSTCRWASRARSPSGSTSAARSSCARREDGEPLQAGRVLIAPAGRHLKLRRVQGEPRLWLDHEPRKRAAPAVDRRAHAVGGARLRRRACSASSSPAWARTAWRGCARSAPPGAAPWPRARRAA